MVNLYNRYKRVNISEVSEKPDRCKTELQKQSKRKIKGLPEEIKFKIRDTLYDMRSSKKYLTRKNQSLWKTLKPIQFKFKKENNRKAL